VISELDEKIRAGVFKPGELLPAQKDLALELRVGVSTIREAIQALNSMGVVESYPGKGTWVRQDPLDSLINSATVQAKLGELQASALYDARMVIEVGLAELAAARATAGDIERIRAALAAMQAVVDDHARFAETDVEFHVAVAEASHSDLLAHFYQLSRALLDGVVSELNRSIEVRRAAINLQHDIAEAIESHNVEQARQAGFNHIRLFGDLLQAYGQGREP